MFIKVDFKFMQQFAKFEIYSLFIILYLYHLIIFSCLKILFQKAKKVLNSFIFYSKKLYLKLELV